MTRNSPDFHPVLRVLHWLMALAVLAMLFIGVAMVSTTSPLYPTLLTLHRPIGIAILLLVCIRLPLRLITGAPALPADLPPSQRLVAKASHVLLYTAMFAMPLIGWAMLSAGGYPIEITKHFILPPILGHDLAVYAFLRQTHTVTAIMFFALILAHLSAALLHGLIRRDGVLRSMTVGHHQNAKPVIEAIPAVTTGKVISVPIDDYLNDSDVTTDGPIDIHGNQINRLE